MERIYLKTKLYKVEDKGGYDKPFHAAVSG